MEETDVAYLVSLRDQFSSRLSAMDKNTKSFDKTMGGLNETVNKFAGIVAGAFEVWGALEFVKLSKEAYDNLEKAVTRVNTVLISTKGAAGLSAEAIEEQAKQLSKSITQGRAEILDAQGMLLSFTGIRGPVFAETTKAVADFATFYKTDMTSAALAIGKAMNNPAEGMTRLQRQGVTFTDTQKETIKHLQSQGKLMEAQRVILNELNTEFGGQAKAFALTDEGKVKMAQKSMTDLKLTIGEVASKIQVTLIPVFTAITARLKLVADWIKHNRDTLMQLGKIILIAAAAMSIFKVANIAVTSAMKVANVVTTLYKGATMALSTGLKTAAMSAEGFKVAIASTGVGLLIIALGFLVEKLMSAKLAQQGVNEKMQEFIELQKKITESTQTFDNRQLLNLRQRKTLYDELLDQQQKLEDAINKDLKPAISPLQASIQNIQKMTNMGIGINKGVLTKGVDIAKLKNAQDTLKKITDQIKTLKRENPGFEKYTGESTTNQGDNITKIESAAPKVFNINIGKLVEKFEVISSSVTESTTDVKAKITEVLLAAINDVQITANI